MAGDDDPASVEELLDQILEQTHGSPVVSVRGILDAVGPRSFGPVVLVAGLIIGAPLIGDIPGVPTLLAMLVLLTVGQLLFGRTHIWLPDWLADRTISRQKLVRGLQWMRKPAAFVDRFTGPRLTGLVRRPGLYVMAGCCMVVAAIMPALELIPFSANLAAIALVAFGLAMIARDGLLALIALSATAGALAIIIAAMF
ncbi:exopolysaccharide biosynthesis protein [Marinobacter sp.]|uniref:exopolysaccharide biosynthesis protein n=1 Tax=Marinobacter sp. TaxID=50741 RepID=UPI00384CDA7F